MAERKRSRGRVIVNKAGSAGAVGGSPVFTYNRHSTGIWIPVQNINIGCLFWWADFYHSHSFTSILFERSPRPPRIIFCLFCLSRFVPLIPVAILLFLFHFISFHSLPRSVGSLHSRASRFIRGRFFLPLLPVFTHYKHSTDIQIPVPNIYVSLLLRSKDLDSPCIYYYVTPSQDHSTGCLTHMTPYPHDPLHTCIN